MPQIVILTFDPDPDRQVRYLGPYQISWWIRENGYDVQVLDFLYHLNKEQRTALFKKYITPETKIIGFAPFVLHYRTVEEFYIVREEITTMFTELKDIAPWAKIVVGGVFSTKLNTYIKDPTWIDAAIKGEGEHAFLDYCDYIFKGAPHPPYKREGKFKVIEATRAYDIQTCGMHFFENDFILPGESLPFELSRGCIFKCKYCTYPNIGKKKDDFNKSIDCIRSSFLKNYELFGATRYHMSDDTTNAHRQRTINFHQMVKELPFKLEYIGFFRLDLLSKWPEQLEILPDSGLVSCQFGIESFDPEACRIIGKGWGATNHKPWLKKVRSEWGNDVVLRCSMIAGLGKETPKHWDEAVDWFKSEGIHDWIFSALRISKTDQRSEFEKNLGMYGYKLSDEDPFSYPGPYQKWTNNYTSFEEARQWSTDAFHKTARFKRMSVWDYTCFKNLGFSHEDIIKYNRDEIRYLRKSEKRTDTLIKLYYEKAINY